MAENEEEKSKRSVKGRMYASCPVCSKTLIQAGGLQNGLIKCDGCRQLISIEISNGSVVTNVARKSESTAVTLMSKSE